MEDDLCEALSRACEGCHRQGGCCFEARPPLSQERIDILMKNGVPGEAIEFEGYKRLRLKPDGYCLLFRDGKCSIHSIKPETCVAGPFTFDVQDHTLRLFLKHESICPLVPYLMADADAYAAQFRMAVKSLMVLVRSLPGQELDVINRIPEPETELVAEIPLDPGGAETA